MPLDRPFNAFAGLSSPFGRRRGFSPADLFRFGEKGTALIVGPTNCFQDAAGTTPAGAGDPVGLVLDTSQGAGYSGGQFTGLGAENIEPALGPYAAIPSEITGPNGTISIENGNIRVTSPGNTSCRMEIDFPVESGKAYSVNTTINSNFGAVPAAFVDVTLGPFNQSFFGVASVSGLVQATSTGTAKIRLYPRSGSGPTQQAGDYVEASAFSVRELPGVHAYQSDNDDYRPTLEQDGNGNWYLAFDGVDDYLVTPSITPGTDKVQVFAGVRKASDAAAAMVAEFSPNFSSLDGSFALRAPVTATSNLGFTSGGTTRNTATASDVSLAAPVTKVMTGLGDIPGDTSTLRLDGVQAAQNTSDQGSGNYLAYPLYIGARAGTGYFFDGRLYGLIVRFGPNLSEAKINRTERYLAQLTGVTL